MIRSEPASLASADAERVAARAAELAEEMPRRRDGDAWVMVADPCRGVHVAGRATERGSGWTLEIRAYDRRGVDPRTARLADVPEVRARMHVATLGDCKAAVAHCAAVLARYGGDDPADAPEKRGKPVDRVYGR